MHTLVIRIQNSMYVQFVLNVFIRTICIIIMCTTTNTVDGILLQYTKCLVFLVYSLKKKSVAV